MWNRRDLDYRLRHGTSPPAPPPPPKHKLREHGDFLRCTACWATWRDKDAAKTRKQPCFELPVPHGHPYERRHYTKLRWFRGANFGDALCDEPLCRECVGHECACDVCTGDIDVKEIPGINAVIEDPVSHARYALNAEQIERGLAR
jgi:hypothetical protein